VYLCDITGLHKKFPKILTVDTLQSFRTCTDFAQFLTTDIRVIFKAEYIAFFYSLFFFSCFFYSFVSSLTIFSLSFSSFIFSFFLCSFLTLYVVIKMVKNEKHMRASSNVILLGDNI
jgi:hypothetical protein